MTEKDYSHFPCGNFSVATIHFPCIYYSLGKKTNLNFIGMRNKVANQRR